MRAITYEAPKSLAQALSLLAAAGEKGRVLAGGTDLLIQMRAGVRQPDLVIDAKAIPELQILSFNPREGLRIGAAVPCYRIIEDPTVRQHYPGLVEAAGLIGSVQIQSRSSLGGNLCNGSPAADTIPALIALGAVCQVAGSKGTRTVAVEDFARGALCCSQMNSLSNSASLRPSRILPTVTSASFPATRWTSRWWA